MKPTGKYTTAIEAFKAKQAALNEAGVVRQGEEDIFDVIERENNEARIESEIVAQIDFDAIEAELKNAKSFDSVEAFMAHLHQ